MKKFELLANVMKTALESPDDSGEVEIEGQVLQYRKDPAPGVRLRVEPTPGAGPEGALFATVFEQSEAPPNDYPSGIPFLAGRVAAVLTAPGETRTTNVQWHVEDAKVTAEELNQLCESEGWVRAKKAPKIPLFLPIGFAVFERDEMSRVVMHTSVGSKGVVMLMEGPKK
jgi:hypothetical protein